MATPKGYESIYIHTSLSNSFLLYFYFFSEEDLRTILFTDSPKHTRWGEFTGLYTLSGRHLTSTHKHKEPVVFRTKRLVRLIRSDPTSSKGAPSWLTLHHGLSGKL